MATKKKSDGPPAIIIKVDGYDASQVHDWLAQRIERAAEEKLDYKVEQAIHAAVKERLTEVIDAITKERVTKEIDATLEAGWTMTNTYGEPSGKVLTVRDRVRAAFDRKDGSYSDSKSYVEKWIQEGVARSLETILKAEVEDARKRLRAAFDDVLKLKFADTMRKMLGVEPS